MFVTQANQDILYQRSQQLHLDVQSLILSHQGIILSKPLSFKINQHDSILIKGANGSGKTTFLRCLAGVIPTKKGVIDWGVSHFYLGHEDALAPDQVVFDYLHRLFKKPKDHYPMILDLGLEPLLSKTFSCLSKGQRKICSFLRLLVCRRPLWLLDEPLANLDDRFSQWVVSVLSRHLTSGGSLVITSHDQTIIPATKVLDLDDQMYKI